MKNLQLIFFSLFISCSAGDKKEENKKENSKNNISNIIVKNIQKTCYKNISKNIIDYFLCTEWTLKEKDIIEIVSLGKKNTSSEIVNVMTPKIPSWISADIIINDKPFTIEINAMSYYYLIDNKGNKELYTFATDDKNKMRKYFIRTLSEDDDQNFEHKQQLSKQNIISKNLDLLNWKNVYSFDNNNNNN